MTLCVFAIAEVNVLLQAGNFIAAEPIKGLIKVDQVCKLASRMP